MAALVLRRVEMISTSHKQAVRHTFVAVKSGSMPVVVVAEVPRGGFKRTPRGS